MRSNLSTTLVLSVLGVALPGYTTTTNTSDDGLAPPIAATAPCPEETILIPEQPVERELAAGERHCYGVVLNKGDYLRVVVEEQGIDITVRVYQPQDTTYSQNVNRYWTREHELVDVDASDSGTHVLEVLSLQQEAPTGRYKIRIDALLSAEQQRRRYTALEGDPRVLWLKEHALHVRSVSPSDTDFSDLQPLKQIIGDAKIVMLGEQSHGDGTTFLAKSRLIKFLHQEMDFDVLAFEAGLYDNWKAWHLLKEGEDPLQAIERSVWPLWSHSEQVQDLIDYLGKAVNGPRPLELAGVDNQFTGSASRDFFVNDLKAFLEQIGAETAPLEEGARARTILQKVIEYAYWSEPLPDSTEQSMVLDALRTMQREVEAHPSAQHNRNAAFWVQVLKSVINEVGGTFQDVRNYDDISSGNRRDAQMARNLIWLSEEYYPRRKLIVWAHTGHISRNLHRIQTSNATTYDKIITMGDGVWEALADRVYVLGFTSYEGEHLRVGLRRSPIKIVKDQEESIELEELMNATDLEYALVDFRHRAEGGEWLRQEILARPFDHVRERADWTQIMDGIMFIRKMARSTAMQ